MTVDNMMRGAAGSVCNTVQRFDVSHEKVCLTKVHSYFKLTLTSLKFMGLFMGLFLTTHLKQQQQKDYHRVCSCSHWRYIASLG